MQNVVVLCKDPCLKLFQVTLQGIWTTYLTL
jgi:hypothetical protein